MFLLSLGFKVQGSGFTGSWAFGPCVFIGEGPFHHVRRGKGAGFAP